MALEALCASVHQGLDGGCVCGTRVIKLWGVLTREVQSDNAMCGGQGVRQGNKGGGSPE
jgi:hypothetical protein